MNGFIYKSFDYSKDGTELLKAFADEPYLVFLDSSLKNSEWGRYSVIAFDPFAIFEESAESVDLLSLKKNFSSYIQDKREEFLPFHGGLIGYLSYDYGLRQEKILRHSKRDINLPDVFFGFYDSSIVIDHFAKKLYISSTGLPEKNVYLREKRAQERLKRIIKKLAQSQEESDIRLESSETERLPLQSNFTKEAYLASVKRALEHIRRGDIYQLNLSQRFELDYSPSLKCIRLELRRNEPHSGFHLATPQQSCGEVHLSSQTNSLEIYKHLRKISPSSFGCYFQGKDYQILSSSPERFLNLRENILQTKPMKGTARRGQDFIEDEVLKARFLHSAKERAELLMITDLERNDLGRVCEYGSVGVKQMRTLEEYATVFQTTSTIEGKLRKDKDCFDALMACFPGGSVTGCPKIRAMRIIEELEPTSRGLYTGSFGYISFSGNMDFNILIRTLLACQNKIYFQAGGGIVADSIPEYEYKETLIKSEAMRACLAATRQPAPLV